MLFMSKAYLNLNFLMIFQDSCSTVECHLKPFFFKESVQRSSTGATLSQILDVIASTLKYSPDMAGGGGRKRM